SNWPGKVAPLDLQGPRRATTWICPPMNSHAARHSVPKRRTTQRARPLGHKTARAFWPRGRRIRTAQSSCFPRHQTSRRRYPRSTSTERHQRRSPTAARQAQVPRGAEPWGARGSSIAFWRFTSYIDSGFGLLNGEVAFLSSTLVAIDITLAGLFWALASDEDV